jgi:hypothetical protein
MSYQIALGMLLLCRSLELDRVSPPVQKHGFRNQNETGPLNCGYLEWKTGR